MRALLVAGAGGHLQELWCLRPRLAGLSDEVTWVTPDTPQSRSLLADEPRIAIPQSTGHDVRATAATTRQALSVLRSREWNEVVSTGSLPAVPFLSVARAHGIPCHFIESAARVSGPSLSARLLEWVPGIHRYQPHDKWPRKRWIFRGSVFDGYVPAKGPGAAVNRVVVTLGASKYGFRRLLEVARRSIPPDADVLWQTGPTDTEGLDIDPVVHLTSDELLRAMEEADVVIAHAGIGSALMAMRAGKCPVLMPRQRAHREHVDDHQKEIATILGDLGLALDAGAEVLDYALLALASERRVVCNDGAPPFVLRAK